MGLSYFYDNQSTEANTAANRTLYFGDVYREPRRRRCMSKDKNIIENDINNKTIHSYFSKDATQKNISNYLYSNNNSNNNIREEDFQNINSSSISTISSNSSNDEQKNAINSTIRENIINIFSRKNKNADIRKAYYLNKNIVKFNKEIIKNNTLFIFDWDDTLFFTTHINPSKNNTFFYESKTEKRLMNTIEYYIVEILNKALSKGTVLIITNSSDGWVHACAKFYYPNLIPILDKIKIISARELYQSEYPSEPMTWKVKTFND